MDVLRSLRKKKAKTQKDVADFLGVDRTTYVKYEVGEHQPDRNTLIKLSEYFDVSIDFILGNTRYSEENLQNIGMTTYEKIKKLCEREGFAISSLGERITNLTINKASITGWKNGSKPRPDKLKAIADYFGVSIEYLIDDKVLPNDEAGEELNEICGKRLKSCRELANESLEFIGELVGVHKSTVLRWEQGKTKKMSIGALDVLARHFDVDIVWLSGESSFKTEYGYKGIKGRISCAKQELIECIKCMSENDAELLLAVAQRINEK